MAAVCRVPVVDLFAGPGGLGEGFSALEVKGGHRPFRIILSVEKNREAHQTLQLRSFFRQFEPSQVPEAYYEMLRNIEEPLPKRLSALYDAYPGEAQRAAQESWCVELGEKKSAEVHERMKSCLEGTDEWVLIGGPPCQAYSIAGRSRNKGITGYTPETDERQYLYVEDLQVIAEHRPAVFVMENVKGLLSATLRNQRVFERILDDLKNPGAALRRAGRHIRTRGGINQTPHYGLFSLVGGKLSGVESLKDFVVQMEDYGIPQARHRLILLGVRSDLPGTHKPGHLRPQKSVNAELVLKGLPSLRAGLSREDDSPEAWRRCLADVRDRRWFKAIPNNAGDATYQEMLSVLDCLEAPVDDRGAEFVACDPTPEYATDWYSDYRLGGACHHSARAHIAKDLHRYLYVACFGRAEGRSPVLAEFPADLLPKHRNVGDALDGGMFSDRFRVQVAGRPSTTITCHIAKDGHYYIHHDPSQCRSLTMREAARLQTFPDNYFFCGPRTSQYTQVGNAVPPLLAHQIAEVVWDLLERIGVFP